ncbi:MAG: MMPL family transporter [Gemmatimonadota bacterium]
MVRELWDGLRGTGETGERWGQWAVRWRWPVIAVALVAAVAMGAGARDLRFGNNYRMFFGPNNPQIAAFDELQKVYTKNDNVLFVLEPLAGDAFSEEVLAAGLDLEEKAWTLPFATRVDALTNFQNTEAEDDDLIVEDLVPLGSEGDPAVRAKAREVALSEPLLVRRLVGPAAEAAGVNVTFHVPPEGDAEQGDIDAARAELVAGVRELAADIEAAHPTVNVRVTGMIMLNNAFFEATRRDMRTLIPLMYVGIVVLLLVLLRSVAATVGTVLVIGFATGSALGLAGWAGVVLTPPSATAPTLILTLAVADCVHILVTALQRMRGGSDKRAAIVESMRVNLQPIFLTSLTTAIGFLSMNFSDSPPFRHLGNITALGVGLAFLFAALFLPAFLAVVPMRVRARPKTETDSRRFAWEESFAEFVLRHRRALLGGMAVMTLGLAAAVPRNDLDDQFVRYFASSVEFRSDTDYTSENLSGLYSVEFSIEAGESGGISNPEYLATLDALAEWYRARPEVVHVLSFSDVMKRVNRSMNGDDPSAYRLPEERDLAAQYLLLYEMSLPFGQDLNNQINVDKSSTRFIITLADVSSRQIREAAEAGEAWLESNAGPGMSATSAGPALMFSHISGRNIVGMLTGTAIALVLVSLTLIVAFQSVRYGLLSLIPNITPALLAFGIWGLTVAQINIALSAVAAMTLGIVVDDTIHFMSKYLRARREQGASPEGAVRFAFKTVAPAMVFTSLVLAGGFLILSLSAFDLNAGMGRLTAITIGLALVTDFLMLAPILVVVGSARDRHSVPTAELAFGEER